MTMHAYTQRCCRGNSAALLHNTPWLPQWAVWQQRSQRIHLISTFACIFFAGVVCFHPATHGLATRVLPHTHLYLHGPAGVILPARAQDVEKAFEEGLRM